MLIPTVPFHSHPRLPHLLPQSLESTPNRTISYHFVNFTNLPSKDVPDLLLNAPARPSSVETPTESSTSSIYNHGPTPYNSAANNDSPSLVSPHVSSSIALNNIRLRTSTTTFKPLPVVLPPVPSIPSTSAPFATTTTNQSSTIPSVSAQKPLVSTLRTNYQKMLAKKNQNSMPPPAVSRSTSTQSQSQSSADQNHMDAFVDLSNYTLPGEIHVPESVADGAGWQCVVSRWQCDGRPGFGVDPLHSHADRHASLVHPAVTSSPAFTYSGDSPMFRSAGLAGGVHGSGGGSGGSQEVLAESAAQIDSVGGSNAMTMEDLLEFLNTPPTPSLHQPPPPTPLSQSSTNTSPLLFDSDEYNRVPNTPLLDPLAFSPSVVSQASPYQTSPSLRLLDDLSYPLFFDSSMTVSSSSVPTSLSCPAVGSSSKSATVNPTSLGLSRANSWGSSVHPSSVSVSPVSSMSPPSTNLRPITTLGNYSSTRSSDSPTSASATVATTSSSVPIPNGIRKNVRPGDLLPVDAPIQPRNYITPSATSRREVPPSVARTFVPSSSKKRSATAAGLSAAEDMQDELAEEESDEVVAKRNKEREGMDPEKRALLEHVEASRKRNTLAARKSRQRKLEHVRGLEELVERLQAENDALKSRVEVCENRLREAGLDLS